MAGTISLQRPELQMPVDCTLGQSCYIQNYVDRDPGPGARDVGCGGLTYDGHKGTDFALPTVAAMRTGVEVRAAAPGVVRAIRDGETDRAFIEGVSVAGKECGNGIVVTLGDGWEAQYCHLRKGSVAVKPGQKIAAGDPLGLVGQSGKAAFPHLHLELRHDGQTVDPFDPDRSEICDPKGAASELWSDPIAYVPSGLLEVGLAATPPDYEAVKAGLPAAPELSADSPALVGWVYGFGLRAGDTVEISIDGPHGFHFEHKGLADASKVLFYRYSGKKRPAEGWPRGTYEAQVTLLRDGEVIAQKTSMTQLD